MNTIKNIFSFIILALCFTNCYDDKGNYSYHDINSITIENFPKFKSLTVGDTIDIKPVFNFSSGVETNNLIYSWEWCKKTRPTWNTKNFYWITDSLSSGELVLRVTDPNTGVVYIQSEQYNIKSEFDTQGWVILGEKDQKSYLTFVKEAMKKDGTGANYWANTVYEDVYKFKNNEELGFSPVKLHEHFCSDRKTVGSFMIVQQGGQGMVDLNGFTFRKEISIDQAFTNHTLPADFKPVNTMSVKWIDAIENYDGKIYTRVKVSDELFHSSSYIQQPLTFQGKEVRAHICLSKFTESASIVLHDFVNNRLMALMDQPDDLSSENIGKTQLLPGYPSDGKAPDGWVPINNLGDNELIHIGYYDPSDKNVYGVGFFMILKDKDGQYWTQDFILNREEYSPNLYLTKCVRNPIDLGPYINSSSVIYNLPREEVAGYVLISKDNNIYLYNRLSPEDPVKLYYTCTGKVTAVNVEKFTMTEAGVGLDNGQFIVLNIKDAKNLTTDKEKLSWQTPEGMNLGRIVDVRFKVGYGDGWSW